MDLAAADERRLALGEWDAHTVAPRRPAASRDGDEELAEARLVRADHPARFEEDDVGMGLAGAFSQLDRRGVGRLVRPVGDAPREAPVEPEDLHPPILVGVARGR